MRCCPASTSGKKRRSPAGVGASYRSGLDGHELGGVAKGLVSEEATHPMGQLRELAHVPDDGALELRLAARRRLAGDRLLQVTVDALVRSQLGAVPGQVEDLD